ncbi:hypothetical protein L7F22_061849 [Adiantum nelumboides]|nr:hypothetical protein [Adiantum nelumboides]
MPFGLTNALATFNRMMDRTFRSLYHCVGTFFDDMIVFLKSEVEHMEHLRAVFETLRKERLVVNGKKSEFFVEEIHFLAYIVSKDGVGMDSAKIKAIQDWPEPVNNLHEDNSLFGHAFLDKRPLLKRDPLPMVFGIEDDLDKISNEMTAVIFKERLTTSGQHASTSSASSTSQSSRSGFCIICNGNHRWYECPKRPNPSTTRRNTNMESCPETEECSTSNPNKGKQAVRAVRVSKVVSTLMLNANTNVSIPANLSNEVLSLLGFVGKHPLNVSVDSGCSTNFVSTMLVSKLRLPTQQSVEAFQVELVDGSYLQCNKKVQQLEFQIQDYQDQLGFSVMLLSH